MIVLNINMWISKVASWRFSFLLSKTIHMCVIYCMIWRLTQVESIPDLECAVVVVVLLLNLWNEQWCPNEPMQFIVWRNCALWKWWLAVKGGKKQKNAGTLASARDNWSNSGYLWMKPMCQPWCAVINIRVRGIKIITLFIPQALMLVAAVSEPQFGHGSDHV